MTEYPIPLTHSFFLNLSHNKEILNFFLDFDLISVDITSSTSIIRLLYHIIAKLYVKNIIKDWEKKFLTIRFDSIIFLVVNQICLPKLFQFVGVGNILGDFNKLHIENHTENHTENNENNENTSVNKLKNDEIKKEIEKNIQNNPPGFFSSITKIFTSSPNTTTSPTPSTTNYSSSLIFHTKTILLEVFSLVKLTEDSESNDSSLYSLSSNLSFSSLSSLPPKESSKSLTPADLTPMQIELNNRRISIFLNLMFFKVSPPFFSINKILGHYGEICLTHITCHFLSILTLSKDLKQRIKNIIIKCKNRIHLDDEMEREGNPNNSSSISSSLISTILISPTQMEVYRKLNLLVPILNDFFVYITLNKEKIKKFCHYEEIITSLNENLRISLKNEEYADPTDIITKYRRDYHSALSNIKLPLILYNLNDIKQAYKDIIRDDVSINKVIYRSRFQQNKMDTEEDVLSTSNNSTDYPSLSSSLSSSTSFSTPPSSSQSSSQAIRKEILNVLLFKYGLEDPSSSQFDFLLNPKSSNEKNIQEEPEKSQPKPKSELEENPTVSMNSTLTVESLEMLEFDESEGEEQHQSNDNNNSNKEIIQRKEDDHHVLEEDFPEDFPEDLSKENEEDNGHSSDDSHSYHSVSSSNSTTSFKTSKSFVLTRNNSTISSVFSNSSNKREEESLPPYYYFHYGSYLEDNKNEDPENIDQISINKRNLKDELNKTLFSKPQPFFSSPSSSLFKNSSFQDKREIYTEILNFFHSYIILSSSRTYSSGDAYIILNDLYGGDDLVFVPYSKYEEEKYHNRVGKSNVLSYSPSAPSSKTSTKSNCSINGSAIPSFPSLSNEAFSSNSSFSSSILPPNSPVSSNSSINSTNLSSNNEDVQIIITSTLIQIIVKENYKLFTSDSLHNCLDEKNLKPLVCFSTQINTTIYLPESPYSSSLNNLKWLFRLTLTQPELFIKRELKIEPYLPHYL